MHGMHFERPPCHAWHKPNAPKCLRYAIAHSLSAISHTHTHSPEATCSSEFSIEKRALSKFSARLSLVPTFRSHVRWANIEIESKHFALNLETHRSTTLDFHRLEWMMWPIPIVAQPLHWSQKLGRCWLFPSWRWRRQWLVSVVCHGSLSRWAAFQRTAPFSRHPGLWPHHLQAALFPRSPFWKCNACQINSRLWNASLWRQSDSGQINR